MQNVMHLVKTRPRSHPVLKGSNIMVLIVDGDSAFRKFLFTLFETCGAFGTCVNARNGAEALAKAKQLLPRLAILDFSMPEMNRFQLARRLWVVVPELRIFLMTAEEDLEVEKEALSSGITAVFSKLDDMGTLVANARAVCDID
jgi:DNA-binding NarL/FixJ family response regulator